MRSPQNAGCKHQITGAIIGPISTVQSARIVQWENSFMVRKEHQFDSDYGLCAGVAQRLSDCFVNSWLGVQILSPA